MVVRPDHEPGSDDRRPLAEGRGDRALAERLQRSVGPAADLLGRLVLDRRERAALVARDGEVGVDRDRRDVDVALDAVAQRGGGVADEAGHVPGDVDARVPGSAVEGGEAAVAVAEHVLGLGEEARDSSGPGGRG